MIRKRQPPLMTEADEAASQLKFPKSKYVPRGENVIDMSALTLPKTPPDRNRDYLDFVRGHSCAAWGEDAAGCGGVTEAAHLEVPAKGQKASDYLCVPLCTLHHRRQHQIGIAQFQISIGVNLWEVSTRLLIVWVRRMKS